MKLLQILTLKLARASLWPLYFLLLAYAARVSPWPRSMGMLISALLTTAAIGFFVRDMLGWLVWFRTEPDRLFGFPQRVALQLDHTGRFLMMAALFSLMPVYLFDHQLIAPEGRPFTAPSLGRLLIIMYELIVWGTFARLLSRSSAAIEWLATPFSSDDHGECSEAHSVSQASSIVSLRFHRSLAWLIRRRKAVAYVALASLASIIVLDMRGYSFTARRLAAGGLQTLLAVGVVLFAHRALIRTINRNAWRWARPSHSWAMALTSAMAFRSSSRARAVIGGLTAAPVALADASGVADDSVPLEDLAAGLQRLCSYAMIALTLLATAWIWDLDLALVRFILGRPVWSVDGQAAAVTWGNVAEAIVFVLFGALAWRYMSTLFAVTIFPRMPDDPGVRFAVVTLCRYAVLGMSILRRTVGGAPGPRTSRGSPCGLGRWSRLRPSGNCFQLRVRNHSSAGTTDPNRRRGHRLGYYRKGRSNKHSAPRRSSTGITKA